MLSTRIFFITIIMFIVANCSKPVDQNLQEFKVKAISDAFAQSFGEEYLGVTRNDEGKLVFRFISESFLYDDEIEKTFEEMLENPDIEDVFSMVYPLENPIDKLYKNFDPGRVRIEKLFKMLYGSTEAEVLKNCVKVPFCGHKVLFNSKHGAAEALRLVGMELDILFNKNPELREFVVEIGGTFLWRNIAGTNRLSNHSFATSIDLNVKKSDYWRWNGNETKLELFSRNQWPAQIVEIFEKHGFIWGGKWWHFDTMHFEYRPEIIAYAHIIRAKGQPYGT